jgi:four helix bundle protein
MAIQRDALASGQDIRDRSFQFACRVVAFCETLYNRGDVARVMAPQLLRSGTSAAAMLEEARAAESLRDFISKCSIALKESRESHVRLRMHEACRVGPLSEAAALRAEAQEIVSIVCTIVRNARRRSALGAPRL